MALNWINVETMKNNHREVSTASEKWIIKGKLHWPLKGLASKRKNHATPEKGWKIFDCKVLGNPIGKLVFCCLCRISNFTQNKL